MIPGREPETSLPTLTLEQASWRRWDAIVAGAGPAGAVTARQLTRQGVSVLLVDRAHFPRWKVCGCCLNGATLAALRALGLEDLLSGCGARGLHEMRLAVGSSRATLPLREGMALSRDALDMALIREAIACGAAFLPGAEAVLLPAAEAERQVRLRKLGQESLAKGQIVVAADGLGGTFLKKIDGMQPRIATNSPIGAGALLEEASGAYEPGTIFMACGRGAYVGAVRLEDGRLDVAAAIRRDRLRRSSGIATVLRQTLSECGFPVPAALDDASWRGTPTLTRARDQLSGRRLFVVGDSAAYVEPFTGEGIAWAIQGAGLLVPYLLRSLDRWNDELAVAWDRRYHAFFRKRRRVCRIAGKLLGCRPAARAAVALLGQAPWLASPWMNEISALDQDWKLIAEGRAT